MEKGFQVSGMRWSKARGHMLLQPCLPGSTLGRVSQEGPSRRAMALRVGDAVFRGSRVSAKQLQHRAGLPSHQMRQSSG